MHCICVIGTVFLMLIPYVISQALNGLRTPSSGRSLNCTFYPSTETGGLKGLPEEATGNVTFNCTCSAAAVTAGKVILLQVTNTKPDVMQITDGAEDRVYCGTDQQPSSHRVVVMGKFLGRDFLTVTALEDKPPETSPADSESSYGSGEPELVSIYPVSIVRKYSSLDTVFIVIIALLSGINTMNMGCHLDLEVVKDNLKRPCAIGIGFTSQYVFMPLIAYGVAIALLQEPNLQLGLFTMGCSPGGGASNFWTLLLEGDAHLSITMTFLSTALALGMMPFWLFTLGGTLFGNLKIHIPFSNILTSLICLIFPLAIGVFIRRFRPNWANFLLKLIRPFTVLMMLFIFTFGIYTNIFMFYVMNWRTMLCGLIVPWCGYIFGAALAIISKRGREQVIAISVETGVQNTGIAIVLLRYSLPQPDADLASVLPVSGSIMLFIPLFLWYLGLVVRNKCFNGGKGTPVSTEDGSLEKIEDGMIDMELPLKDDDMVVHKNGDLKIFTGLHGKPFPVPSSQQELLKEVS